MDNQQYNRETLAAGYWVLHNFHYGHVAQARCELEQVKSVSIHKAPSADNINLSLDLVSAAINDTTVVELEVESGKTLNLSEHIEYQCQRGVTYLMRCLIPSEYAAGLLSEKGFVIRIDGHINHIDSSGATHIIDNAIRHAH